MFKRISIFIGMLAVISAMTVQAHQIPFKGTMIEVTNDGHHDMHLVGTPNLVNGKWVFEPVKTVNPAKSPLDTAVFGFISNEDNLPSSMRFKYKGMTYTCEITLDESGVHVSKDGGECTAKLIDKRVGRMLIVHANLCASH